MRASSASTSPDPEAGYRPTRHLDAFDLVRRENFHITIHAGEVVRAAVHLGGAPVLRRRAARATASGSCDDITVRDDGSVELGRSGRLRARPARAARDVPDVQRPHGSRRVHRGAPVRPAPAPPRSGSRSTRTTG
ncbi:MAG: hypothetical protein WKF78_11995 [Candidatus Limnocylindrales bacterium]